MTPASTVDCFVDRIRFVHIRSSNLYPDAQHFAQKELDEVVGRDRLPSIPDRASGRLKYIEAIVKEVLRWSSVAPLGIPHVCTEED